MIIVYYTLMCQMRSVKEKRLEHALHCKNDSDDNLTIFPLFVKRRNRHFIQTF